MWNHERKLPCIEPSFRRDRPIHGCGLGGHDGHSGQNFFTCVSRNVIPARYRPEAGDVLWCGAGGVANDRDLWLGFEPRIFLIQFEKAGRVSLNMPKLMLALIAAGIILLIGAFVTAVFWL